MDFYAKYREFLRLYIDEKYLQQFNNVTVLGENFLDNYYVVLFETQEDSLVNNMPEMHRFILVENIGKPIIHELNVFPYNDGYIRIRKSELAKIVEKKIYKKFVNRGIATTKEIGERKNKPFCWHRLIACLYYDCLDKEVHHINKVRTDNNINNLVALTKREHTIIDNDEVNGRNFAISIQRQAKAKIFKKRTTVACNDKLLEEIIELYMCGYKVKKIIKAINRSIKKSSIYKIIGRIYYVKEFIFWPHNQELPACQQLNGNYLKRWSKIIEFENPQHRALQIMDGISTNDIL